MARKEIGNPMDDTALNNTNHNFIELYDDFKNVVDKVSDQAFQQVINGSKIDWEQMVDTVGSLPTNAKEGETRGVKADNKFYRYDGKKWVAIGEINLNPIQEVDDRLSSQLAEKANEIDTLEEVKAEKAYVDAELFNKANKNEVRKNTSEQPINVSEMDTETKKLFTGGAVAVVGEDAVGEENLKSEAVSNSKLADNYNMVHSLSDGSDANTLLREGYYYKNQVNEVANVPSEFSGKAMFFEVKKYNDLIIMQEAYDYSSPTDKYIRRITSGTYHKWESVKEITTKNMLGTELLSIKDIGMYYGDAGETYPDLPDELAGKNFMLKVESFGDDQSVRLQTIYQRAFPENSYVRFTSTLPGGDSAGAWRKNYWLTSFEKDIEYETLTNDAELSTIVTSGRYLGLSSVNYSDIPISLKGVSFLFEVIPYGINENFIIQKITQTGNNLSNSYSRYIQHPSVVGSWFKDNSFIESEGSGLANKKIVCFGDSITEFGNYPEVIAQKTGAITYNVGFGGCRMANVPPEHARYVYNEMSMVSLAETIVSQDFVELEAAAINLRDNHSDDNTEIVARLKSIDFNDVDIITIFYGTNDYTSRVPLGDVDSIDDLDFNGSVNLTVQRIQQAYPHLQIVFISPIWRSRINPGDGLESDSNPNGDGILLPEIVDNLLNRAKEHKLPCMDFYYTSGINQYNAEYMLSDGVHPSTPNGYEHIGGKIASYLTSVVSL